MSDLRSRGIVLSVPILAKTKAKTKALISWAVSVQLIFGFVLAYAKDRFSHDVAHISMSWEICVKRN